MDEALFQQSLAYVKEATARINALNAALKVSTHKPTTLAMQQPIFTALASRGDGLLQRSSEMSPEVKQAVLKVQAVSLDIANQSPKHVESLADRLSRWTDEGLKAAGSAAGAAGAAFGVGAAVVVLVLIVILLRK